jgi:hypothetical protein
VEQYWIPSHVRACSLSTNTILLDLNRNRYFSIGMRETRALFTLALNWSAANTYSDKDVQTGLTETPMDPAEAARIADALVDRGLLSRAAPGEADIIRNFIELRDARASVGRELTGTATTRCSHVLGFLRACMWAKRALRSKSLYSIAQEISRKKACAGEYFDDQRAIELVCSFRRLRAYSFGTRERCLFHALSLVHFLADHELFPHWVIGVRDQPWAAHSWVQQDSLILDGTPEQVFEYTPILVV